MSNNLAIVGCGTVGYWATRAILRSAAAGVLSEITVCDRAPIKAASRITCPRYTTVGQPKCERLAELATVWSQGRAKARPIHGSVEELDWQAIYPAEAKDRLLVVIGLDRWSSRLIAVEDFRRRLEGSPEAGLAIQVGLDRGQAAISVMGGDWADPCPACGLSSLPAPEPCIAYSAPNVLLRGTLRAEARMAARMVVRIICDELGRAKAPQKWINTKTSLTAANSSGKCWHYEQLARPFRAMPGCLGPHAGAAPLDWDDAALAPAMETP